MTSEKTGSEAARPRPRPTTRPAPATGGDTAALGARSRADDGTSKRTGHRAITIVIGALAVLLVAALAAVAVLAVLLSDRNDKVSSANRVNAARASALTAAKQYAVDFVTYDYRTFSKNVAKIESELTGKYKKRFTTTAAALGQAFTTYMGRSTGKLSAIAVQTVSEHDAVVIAFIDQTIVNSASSQPQIDRNRMQMTLHREGGGTWLIRDLQLL